FPLALRGALRAARVRVESSAWDTGLVLASLAGCMRRSAGRILSADRRAGSPGADLVGGAAPADQLDGNHARGRGSGDPGDPGVRLVVQVVQRPRQPHLGRVL